MSMRFLLILLLVFSSIHSEGQTFSDFDKIEVKWNLKENGYQSDNAFLAEFVIINKHSEAFPLDKLKLYFSYPRKVNSVLSENIVFENLNGEFCRLDFSKLQKSLSPLDSIQVSYIASGKSKNITDAPSGLYWASDQGAKQTYPVKSFKIDHIPEAEKKALKLSPEIVFAKNQGLSPIPAEQLPLILPSPRTYQRRAGFYQLTAATTIASDEIFSSEADMLNEELRRLFGKRSRQGTRKSTMPGIDMRMISGLSEEAYQISINRQQIVLSASSSSGMFYAIQSLKMLMPPDAGAKQQHTTIAVPCVDVDDSPRFGYRSFMLDVARNFQTKEEIFKILDLLALYKLNTFHFHLTDDEGWRLEIPSLPELTEIGSKRGHTLNDSDQIQPSYGSGDMARFPGTGFYTKADFIKILRYAHARHIVVIPEIETPGHARAAIKAMYTRYRRFMEHGNRQEAERYLLNDTLDRSVYTSVQGYHDNVMNMALPSTYAFIERVVDDVREMYQMAGATLKTIHLGGDEVPQGVWERSPSVKQFMLENNISNYDDLWYGYLAKVSDILTKKGLYLSGWEEVAMRKTKLDGVPVSIANPDFVTHKFHAYVWNNVWGWGQEDLAYRLANAGYKVILAPVTNTYFDLAYEKDADEPGLYWGSFVDLDKPFYYNPFDHYKTAKEDTEGNALDTSIFNNKVRLTAYGASNIVGMQCQIWSEKIRGPEQLEYMLLPKLIGFAERAWAKTPDWATGDDPAAAEKAYQRDWNTFVNILAQKHLPRLDHYAGGFQYRIPSAGAKLVNGQVIANVQFPGFKIRYTTNGTEPDHRSSIYSGPIALRGIIKLKVFNANGRAGRTVEVNNNR